MEILRLCKGEWEKGRSDAVAFKKKGLTCSCQLPGCLSHGSGQRGRTGVYLAEESARGTQETLSPRVSVCPMARPGPVFAVEQGICLRVPALDSVEDRLV